MDGAETRLARSNRDRMLLGVSGGLGEYFGVDPTLIRLSLVLLTVLGQGLGLVAYFALALAMPSVRALRDRRPSPRALTRDADLREVALRAWPTLPATSAEKHARRWRVLGTIFLLIGLFYLLAGLNLLVMVRWDLVLSVGLIALGLAMLARQARR